MSEKYYIKTDPMTYEDVCESFHIDEITPELKDIVDNFNSHEKVRLSPPIVSDINDKPVEFSDLTDEEIEAINKEADEFYASLPKGEFCRPYKQ